jgi:sugar phosphate isomerase/epimerase
MKIGVFSILFNDLSLDDTLDHLSGLGTEAVEIGTGGYSRSNHCNMEELLGSSRKLEEYRDKFRRRNMFISALSAHGNPVHPDKAYAAQHNKDFENTVLLAEKLGLDTVLLASGCPGGSPEDHTPNWVTCAWPEDFLKILDYQWNDVLIPYWRKAAEFAREHGVTKLGIEPHPGFCVYNTETLLRLRNAVGKEIGINFDPSHFFWQGMDPVQVIMELKDCIFHIHAKDVYVNDRNVQVNGLLDTKPYSAFTERSWIFRTVGYGHPEEVWRNIISALAAVGYDYVLSVEHEDCLMTRDEGLAKAVEMLGNVIIKNKVEKMWWELRAEG